MQVVEKKLPGSLNLESCRWASWISKQVQPSGLILDPDTGQSLPFQYHYTSYLLGQALSNPNHFSEETTQRGWAAFRRFPSELTRPSREFNAWLCTLILQHLPQAEEHAETIASLIAYLDQIGPTPLPDLKKLNNNFRAMALYTATEGHRRRPDLYSASYLEILRGQVLALQQPDGFVCDTSITGKPGLPSLVYHAKISALLVLQGTQYNDKEAQEAGQRGLSSLLALCPVRHAMAYGRSQNALFGWANYYLGLKVMASATADPRCSEAAIEVRSLIRDLEIQQRGEHALNLAGTNKARPGFDTYMYGIVYNSYAWAMCLLAESMSVSASPKDTASPVVASTTFFKMQTKDAAAYGSLYDPQGSAYAQDPRYVPGIPAVVYYKNKVLVPAISLPPKPLFHWHDRRWYYRLRRFFLRAAQKVSGSKLEETAARAGFLPFLSSPGQRITAGAVESIQWIPEAGILNARYTLKRVRHNLRPGNTSQAPLGWLDWTLKTFHDGLFWHARIELSQPFSGEWAGLNLRLPDGRVEVTQQGGTHENGTYWHCTPSPQGVVQKRVLGTDGPQLLYRGFQSVHNACLLEQKVTLIFPEGSE